VSDLKIEIDGKELDAQQGEMIIEVADRENIRIPRFCYHKNLSIAANCRMCLVEVEKAPKPLPACATPITDGMKIKTRSPIALQAQKAVMEFLLINHPLDCPVCDQGGECELQDISMGYGEDVSRYNQGKRSVADQSVGPLIETFMTRCIHCTRCVRFGDEISGMRELGMVGRGEKSEITTYVKKNIESELSGNVIDLCPVGALTNKPFRFKARTWEMKQHATIAPHDCVGSNIFMHERYNEIMRVVPRENNAINETWIADRDRYSHFALYTPDRVTQPMIKVNNEWQTTDWATALEHSVAGLQKVLHKHGADAVGALASQSETLESYYMFQYFLRHLGVHNIDHRLQQQDFADQDLFPAYPHMGTTFAELEQADAVLLIGSHTRKEQPMLWHRLHKASRNGAKMYAVNPVDFDLVFALEKSVTPEGGDLLAGLQQLADSIPEGLQSASKPAILLGALALNHPQAASLRKVAQQIADKVGATLGLLSAGGNSAGAWAAGVLPHRLPGNKAANKPGENAQTMLAQQKQAYVLLNVEPELDCANAGLALKAMQNAEFVLAVTSFTTEDMLQYANVILPAAPFNENSGHMINAQGDCQQFNAVIPPKGEARPAWKIFRVLSQLCQIDDVARFINIADVYDAAKAELGEPETIKWAGESKQTLGKGTIRIAEMPIYAIDPVVRRALPLQETHDATRIQGVHMHQALADSLQVKVDDSVSVQQDGANITLPVIVDNRMPGNTVYIAQGLDEHKTLGAGYAPVEIKRA
jgi:NADH-quinone oxidoreductase subunit G